MGIRTLVVDLSAVPFFDSAGVELLCECHQQALSRSASIHVVTNNAGPVDRVLDLLDVGSRFACYRSVDQAFGRIATA